MSVTSGGYLPPLRRIIEYYDNNRRDTDTDKHNSNDNNDNDNENNNYITNEKNGNNINNAKYIGQRENFQITDLYFQLQTKCKLFCFHFCKIQGSFKPAPPE